MKTQRLSLVLAGLVTLHLLGFALVAAGEAALLSETISYGDLDLSNESDAAVLYERIGHAAAQVCAGFDGASSARQSLERKCVATAIAHSVAHVNDANLSARHDAYARLRLAARVQRAAS